MSNMTNRFLKFFLGAVTLLELSSLSCLATDPQSDADFLSTVKSSFQAKDVSKFMTLECWDNTPAGAEKFQEKLVGRLMQSALIKAELLSIEPITKLPTADGSKHELNLTVTKKLKVTLKSEKIPMAYFLLVRKMGNY